MMEVVENVFTLTVRVLTQTAEFLEMILASLYHTLYTILELQAQLIF